MNTNSKEINLSKPVQANSGSDIELTPEQLDAVFGGWATTMPSGSYCNGAHRYEDTGYTQPLNDPTKYLKEQICRKCHHTRWVIRVKE